MLKKEILTLVEGYGLKDVLSVLIQVGQDQADQLSDLGLKEKAIETAETVDLLKMVLIKK